MLFAVALLAALLGYTQWRRHTLLQEAADLETQGFKVVWQDSWIASIWPRAAQEATFTYYPLKSDQYRTASGVYSGDELNELYGLAIDRLHLLSVDYVRLDSNGKPSHTFTGTKRGSN
jgi:hypothetical protein